MSREWKQPPVVSYGADFNPVAKPRSHLHLVPAFGTDHRLNALVDLDDYAQRLRQITDVVRPCAHAMALGWIHEWRAYCFELNPQRWPDGKFYLLNRSYQHWRGHRIAFDREELARIGVVHWNARRIHAQSDEDFLYLASDQFISRPGRKLRDFTAVMQAIADAFEARP